MVITIPQTEYRNLIKIIDREYTDRLDRILSAQIDDDGRIIAYAQDGNKRLIVEISDTQIRFKLLGVGDTAQFAQQPDIPEQIATKLQHVGNPIFGGWLTQIQQIIETSDDLETAREALFQLYPDLDSTELTDEMTDAMSVASMAGWWDAKSEAEEEAEFARIPEGTMRHRNGVDYVLKGSRWHTVEDIEEDNLHGLTVYENKTKPINPKQAIKDIIREDNPKRLDHLVRKYEGMEFAYEGINRKLSESYGVLAQQAYDKTEELRKNKLVGKARKLDMSQEESSIYAESDLKKLYHLEKKYRNLQNFYYDADVMDRADAYADLKMAVIDRLDQIDLAEQEARGLKALSNPKARFISTSEGQSLIDKAETEARAEHLYRKFNTLSDLFEPGNEKRTGYYNLAKTARTKLDTLEQARLKEESRYTVDKTDDGFSIKVNHLSVKDSDGEWEAEPHEWTFTKFGDNWSVDKGPVAVRRPGAKGAEIKPGQRFKAGPLTAAALDAGMLKPGSRDGVEDVLKAARKERLGDALFQRGIEQCP